MHHLYTFLIMLIFWVILSGKFDAFHLSLGVISCLIVSFLSADLLFENTRKKGRLKEAWRFLKYSFWLLYEIVIANINVAYLALHPKAKELLDPTIITFKSKLKKNISRVSLANSITLTPGTITIRIEDDVFYVHALTRNFAQGVPGEMEERLARIFEDE